MGSADGFDLWQYLPSHFNGPWRFHGRARSGQLEAREKSGPHQQPTTHVRSAGDRHRTFRCPGSINFSGIGYCLLGSGTVGVFGSGRRSFRPFRYKFCRAADSHIFNGRDAAGPGAVFYR